MAALCSDVRISDAPASHKSPVWQYFGFERIETNGITQLDKSKTVCKTCHGSVSYATGTTSNMSTHLKRKHPDLFAGLTKQQQQQNKMPKMSATQNDAKPSASGQLRLHDMLKCKLSHNNPRALAITKAVGQFMAKDLRPYSVVENLGFKNLVHELEPRYALPGRTHFANAVIPRLYDETKSEVVQSLSKASLISLTTDGWTSRATESYETITAHFVNNEWEFQIMFYKLEYLVKLIQAITLLQA